MLLALISIFSILSIAIPMTSAQEIPKTDSDLEENALDLDTVFSEEMENESPDSLPPKDITKEIRIEEIVEPTDEYHYAAFGKPSPFKSPNLRSKVSKTEKKNDKIAPGIPIVSPLQKYPIDTLSVKGIWQLRNKEWRAIFLTPEKEGMIVKIGDPVADGKVLSINKKSITLRIYQYQPDGTRTYDDKRLPLRRDKKIDQTAQDDSDTPIFTQKNAKTDITQPNGNINKKALHEPTEPATNDENEKPTSEE